MTERGAGRSTWLQGMNATLQRDDPVQLSALDLFCGAGGLSLGFWVCGFDVIGLDYDAEAVKTYRRNFGEASCVDLNDVRRFPPADVLIAGPPCQPWSRAGTRLGVRDGRDGLDIVTRSVRDVRPRAVVVENVPDLARSSNRQHVDRFEAQLDQMGYTVREFVLNAADHGVPQKRRRIFITAVLNGRELDAPTAWSERIAVRKAIPGTYRREAASARLLSPVMDAYIERYEQASGCRVPRDLHPDRPSRTLTVRNLTGATGDMMRLRLPDGRRRTLTVREAARLQSFPDWFRFQGSDRSKLTQIGNAVPPLLARAVAATVRDRLISSRPADDPASAGTRLCS